MGTVENTWHRQLAYLFMDCNAFFAGAEQHDNPALRGRPVIVIPQKSDHTSAIAASYEARPYGIKRGTMVREAKTLCPDLVVLPARHDRYVQIHKLLLAEVEKHIPVTKVYSIDEWACRLAPSEGDPAKAMALAERIRESISTNLSPALRFSAGLAQTRLLAKLAAESQKPDGLTVFAPGDLPDRLDDIDIIDIPGIGPGVDRRLQRIGVTTFRQLWNMAPKQARQVWGSVQGERFWYALHGYETHEDAEPEKRMIGHGRVLSREHETPEGAKIVTRALLLKAASRLRHYGMYASALNLSIRMRAGVDHDGERAEGDRWGSNRQFSYTQDTYRFLDVLDDMWTELLHVMPRLHDGGGGRRIGNVSLFLHGLAREGDSVISQGDLFDNAEESEKEKRRAKLWAAIDRINTDLEQKYARLGAGERTRPPSGRYVNLAAQQGLDLNYLGAKIAFSRVPEDSEFLF
ncbi:hypothetical protein FF098_001930 [Parvularcula flava]|uniref:DNA-directed DNA polymerase n=1 Tax=Aquisalinus luteolus TaxID=1566827 RepID=A0A8J3A0H4_9PROT|nr:hypothetical protein [Aquisalinus luteolus]NHK26665.1 hypothetical protein [Aquisalinus luteolus]GGH93033.1 hypothetical protein GCM10011355_03920 [Aquisalinus luteolus]